MTNLKIKDLFKIDYFNYWLLSEICDYLFDDISNGKCYLTNWVSSCNLIDNENFEKIYMSILEKKYNCDTFFDKSILNKFTEKESVLHEQSGFVHKIFVKYL